MKEEQLRNNLLIFFDESEVEIINNSEKHRHHSGYSDGESHFLIKISSDKLKYIKAIEKHRHVISLIGRELTDLIHSIEIKFHME